MKAVFKYDAEKTFSEQEEVQNRLRSMERLATNYTADTILD